MFASEKCEEAEIRNHEGVAIFRIRVFEVCQRDVLEEIAELRIPTKSKQHYQRNCAKVRILVVDGPITY